MAFTLEHADEAVEGANGFSVLRGEDARDPMRWGRESIIGTKVGYHKCILS